MTGISKSSRQEGILSGALHKWPFGTLMPYCRNSSLPSISYSLMFSNNTTDWKGITTFALYSSVNGFKKSSSKVFIERLTFEN